ncbi:MAG: peptide ABC transporter permease [Epsilonproteobacteria bacterium (ex Lamellibrachia satsuma)]|nr:MAG: peptide ABC transporter permease [Epsilonproteobacteria bacterium (ex Lamellibrachia satsuma)]
MSIVLLWTDIMVWALVISLLIWGWVVSRSVQIKKQWHTIFKSSIAMVSAMVLLFYLFFALLDSIHLRFPIHSAGVQNQKVQYEGDIVSPLDLIFSHNIESTERTYSAPFSTHEYAKSIVVDENGVTKQAYLPLKYVSQSDDLVLKSFAALVVGLIISCFLIVLHIFWRAGGHFMERFRQTWQGKTHLPWRTAYLTITLLIMTFTWLYMLSFHYHVLGTDKVGGDVLYQSFKSIRTGVLIGVLTTLIMLPVAILLGVSAGLFGGWVDDMIQYLYTTLSSIPGVLLIAAGVLVMQVMIDTHPHWFETTLERSDLRLLFLIMILGITSWTGLCRMLRAETLKISQMEFVTAAKAFGVGKFTIIRRHIVPNLMHIILISVVLDFSGLVLAEAVLSYVGVGVDPTMYSWGNMINQARLEMARDPMVWWSLFSAFVFMFILVLAANLLSDRVQTVLDPRNRV